MAAQRPGYFKKLALATTAATYGLILFGGLVRAAGAGMGCPDWPRCYGRWIPPTRLSELPPGFDPSQFNAALTWTEYLNRLLGVTTGFLILGTLAAALAGHRRDPRILWPVVAAVLGVGYQGWLGGRVVAHQLAPWVVTAHLLAALLIVSLLLYATVNAFFPVGPSATLSRSGARLGRLACALIVLTVCQIVLGTQVRGAIDLGAATIPRERLVASVGLADVAHRNVALAVFAASVGLFVLVRRVRPVFRPLRIAAAVALVLCGLQIAAGGVLAYLGLPRAVQVAHVSIASLLLGAQTLLALVAFRFPADERAGADGANA
jgi:cytochrome c oxidase assembly protein subunit 15